MSSQKYLSTMQKMIIYVICYVYNVPDIIKLMQKYLSSHVAWNSIHLSAILPLRHFFRLTTPTLCLCRRNSWLQNM